MFRVLCVLGALLFFPLANIDAPAGDGKRIALTFDDGPRSDVLKELIPLLESHHATATFFVIGGVLETPKNRALVHELSQKGFEYENHTFGHPNLKQVLTRKGRAGIVAEVKKCEIVIEEVTGRKPRFLRPPFWSLNPEIRGIIEGLGYRIVTIGDPDINTEDYDDVGHHRSSAVLIARVKKDVEIAEKHGATDLVLTFHELPLTVEALKQILPYLETRGYSFVRLDVLTLRSH